MQTDTSATPRTTGLRALPLSVALVAGCAALYAIAVRTAVGQRLEDSTLTGFLDEARLYPFHRDVGIPPLGVAAPTIVLGVAAIVAVGAARRRWIELVGALAGAGLAMLGTEVLGELLPRPPLDVSVFGATGNTFPSGHAAIPIALVLGLAAVVPPGARPWVVRVGGAWVALVSSVIQSMYWHRPSDVLGAALLTCACVLVVGHVIGDRAPRTAGGAPVRAGPVLLPASAVALVAATRTDSWTTPLVFSLVAWSTVALLWLTVRSLEAAELRPGRRRPS
jgi:membrane-associated phospholipid phosphatase